MLFINNPETFAFKDERSALGIAEKQAERRTAGKRNF
jgi:hypothetical protein